MSNNATLSQGAHTLKLIADQNLDLGEVNKLHLYLPALAAGIKVGSIPSFDEFITFCEGHPAAKLSTQTVTLYCPYKTSETNLEEAIALSEKFAKKVLGVSVNLRKQFNLPNKLPWKNVMLVYDPGFDNRKAVERAIKSQGLVEGEETDVMEYSGSAKSAQPTLHIIENSINPTADTLSKNTKSPNQLNANDSPYLELRGYALAFGQRYFGFKDFLDPRTWTWFPKNCLQGGGVGRSYWNPICRRVSFDWSGYGCVNPRMGARLAMPVSLKS